MNANFMMIIQPQYNAINIDNVTRTPLKMVQYIISLTINN